MEAETLLHQTIQGLARLSFGRDPIAAPDLGHPGDQEEFDNRVFGRRAAARICTDAQRGRHLSRPAQDRLLTRRERPCA